jgi:hypothetical protein
MSEDGETFSRTRPSFRLIELSSHASLLARSSSTSPLDSSTQTFTPMSPLPRGIEPEASLLGVSQTTL